MRLIPLSEIASAVDAVLPTSFTDEIRKTIQMAVLSTIRKMNLVHQKAKDHLAEERPRWKNQFGEVIPPAVKAALKWDQDKKEVFAVTQEDVEEQEKKVLQLNEKIEVMEKLIAELQQQSQEKT